MGRETPQASSSSSKHDDAAQCDSYSLVFRAPPAVIIPCLSSFVFSHRYRLVEGATAGASAGTTNHAIHLWVHKLNSCHCFIEREGVIMQELSKAKVCRWDTVGWWWRWVRALGTLNYVFWPSLLSTSIITPCRGLESIGDIQPVPVAVMGARGGSQHGPHRLGEGRGLERSTHGKGR